AGSGARPTGGGATARILPQTEESLTHTLSFQAASRNNTRITTPNAASGAGVARTSTGGGGANQAQTGSAISTAVTKMIPFPAFSTYYPNSTATSVNHQDQSVATTISFNLA
ncbi:hypothetical protein ACNJUX_21280, partial [Mycobacterium tuberculosis]